ncbi:hypothetical protein EVAR_50847_1 [Eumeta japonica]|uniref:Uncharacterized protein n=1 Tax=Eumeta variegata TaxID=151549 RepID=A0A4C1XGN3_EUMVA|nr:hypothetical protein EVAR_50847_1 [Eumeta japonica]
MPSTYDDPMDATRLASRRRKSHRDSTRAEFPSREHRESTGVRRKIFFRSCFGVSGVGRMCLVRRMLAPRTPSPAVCVPCKVRNRFFQVVDVLLETRSDLLPHRYRAVLPAKCDACLQHALTCSMQPTADPRICLSTTNLYPNV